jgi:hypothetical protein
MKATFNTENGIVSVEYNKAVVILSLDNNEFKMTEHEGKQLQKALKAVM